MKLEVGMYVRTDNGIIGKIYEKNGDMFTYKDNNRDYITYDLSHYEIIKASFNIIDILEVGDYVNGSIILGFENEYIEENDKFVPFGIITENCYLDNNDSWLTNKDIKSIVTHEQIEQISYKLGE